MTGNQQWPPMIGGNGQSPMTSPEGLDLVEEEEQITHEIQLEKDLKVNDGLPFLATTTSAAKTSPKKVEA